MSTTGEDLKQRCERVHSGLGQAIEWVEEVRSGAPRLERDGDGLVEKLRRSRNLCRRLGAAAMRPLSIGVFGMSQAGKSYLVSSLARGAHGHLFTELEGHRLNFIGHINPPGGGKEATGLVTRFTRRLSQAPPGYPVELTLFSEADLIKILGNSFFNDFDKERVSIKSDAVHVREHLEKYARDRQARPTGGLDEDAMVDVMDYFEKRFTRSMGPLRGDFWPTVIELAPRLPAQQRGGLLSLLWGEIPELTRAYVQLRDGLEKLSGVRTVYVPLDALVIGSGDDFQWNPDSIINVDTLNHLGKDEAVPLRVVPVADGRPLPEAAVARSLLATLTAELTFVLSDAPVAALLEHVDLLDFPGYRGRLRVTGLGDVRAQVERDDADPVVQLLLRGKVAYLFERYTDDQEMNMLIMCTRCDHPIEIADLAPVLDTWVHATQGDTPAERTARRPGLAWVLTQFDHRVTPKPNLTESQQRTELNTMIKVTLLDRFAQCEWLTAWTPGRPFNNVFLVRKPGFLSGVIETTDDVEGAYLPEHAERLARARAMFIDADNVKRHVADAGAAWDAVLKPDDGGMERLAAYLDQAVDQRTKLARIAEQVQRVTDDVTVARLGPYYFAEGAGELEKKQTIAARIAAAIQEHADSFGELLFHLQPPAEYLRQLYLRADANPRPAAGPTPPAAKRGRLVRLPATKAAAAQPQVTGRAWLFAKTVMSTWTKQLHDLSENADVHRHLGLGRDVLQALADELISGSDRVRIEERMGLALQPQEEKRSTTRGRIVDQQVFLARIVVNDFIDTLGIESILLGERAESAVEGRKLFEPPPPIPAGALPDLPAEEINYTGAYIVDWLEAFRLLAVGNAGHWAGREIGPEQNRRLGEILSIIRGGAEGAVRT